jgi:cytochrome c553
MKRVIPLVGAAVLAASIPAQAGVQPQPADLRPALEKSLSLLDKAQVAFARQATCASCHHQIQPRAAGLAARAKGVPANPAILESQTKTLVSLVEERRDYNLYHGVTAGAHSVTAMVMAGMADAGVPGNDRTDVAVTYLMAKQSANGAWRAVAVRSPSGASDFQTTAHAVRAIDAYAPPALRDEADARIARARAWLIATPPSADGEALTQRLRGLVWAHAPRAAVDRATAQLVSAQQPDGGWAQRPGMESDAYATADALVALSTARLKPGSPAYRKGLEYLLRTQASDGSWHVKSRALPIQPTINGGFPYGQDQWISAWATALAATAIAYAL